MNVPLDGGMWALALLHMPMFRTPLVMVASVNRSEVTTSDLDRVLLVWNSTTDFSGATHPKWEGVGDGVYFSIVQWSALAGVVPPTALGVSDTLSEYRITGDGMTIMHNTPSLINQGVLVTAQFNADVDHITVEPDTDGTTVPATLVFAGQPTSNGYNIGTYFPGIDTANATTVFTELTSTFAPYGNASPATHAFKSETSTIAWEAGDIVQLYIRSDGDSNVALELRRTRASEEIVLSRVTLPISFGQAIAGVVAGGQHYRALCNALALPPVAQEDMTQATPKTIQMLMKEFDGGYVVKRVFNPIYPMTKATQFAPVRFKTSNTTRLQFEGATGGLLDSFDGAYGISVTNISSLPNAAQPYIKLMRTYEAIASRGSPWGPFATSTPAKDDVAITIVRTVHDLDPFMYPAHYNGLGMMFSKVWTIIRRIPSWMRSGAIVAQAVGDIVENATVVADRAADNVRKTNSAQRLRVVN
jgi:hypothetical protein